MFQSQQVVLLPDPIQVSPAEGERVKVFVDRPQQAMCGVNTNRDRFGHLCLPCVVRAITLINDVSSTCGTECFDGVVFAFFHFYVEIGHGDDGDGFATVNRVSLDAVTVEVLDTLDLVSLAVDLEFVGFHDFLDGSTDFA